MMWFCRSLLYGKAFYHLISLLLINKICTIETVVATNLSDIKHFDKDIGLAKSV